MLERAVANARVCGFLRKLGAWLAAAALVLTIAAGVFSQVVYVWVGVAGIASGSAGYAVLRGAHATRRPQPSSQAFVSRLVRMVAVVYIVSVICIIVTAVRL